MHYQVRLMDAKYVLAVALPDYKLYSKMIIDALQYNLEELDELSIDELDALKNTVTTMVNTRIAKISNDSQNQNE